jgi:glycosyltransferase involved in cell wall biosynthesis
VPSRSKPLRVAVVATHPVQYQAPLWRALASDPRLDLHVYFGSDLSVRGYRDEGFGVEVRWDSPLTAGYAHTILNRDVTLQRVSFWRPGPSGIGRCFQARRPDVVLLTAYHSRLLLAALLAARVRGIPVVMRHEASDVAQARPPLKQAVRDLVLRAVYAQIAQFAVIGTNARAHLRRLGVTESRLTPSPYCVDSAAFERQYEMWAPRRSERRTALGIRDTDFALIFSGKLIPKKQPLMLVDAIRRLPEELRARVHLIVVGEGELRGEVEAQGRGVLGSRLHLAGFVNQSELGSWYAVADCLVLPSRRGAGETWGLVVNEALQFGLCVLVSDGVGCHPDLVESPFGRVFDATSVDGLREAIESVVSVPPARKELWVGLCRKKAQFASVDAARAGLVDALERATLPSMPLPLGSVGWEANHFENDQKSRS